MALLASRSPLQAKSQNAQNDNMLVNVWGLGVLRRGSGEAPVGLRWGSGDEPEGLVFRRSSRMGLAELPEMRHHGNQ